MLGVKSSRRKGQTERRRSFTHRAKQVEKENDLDRGRKTPEH